MVSVSSCCCCCTLRTGTLVLAWLSLIGSALNVLKAVQQFVQLDDVEATADLIWPDCSKDESCISSVRNAVVGFSTYSLICSVVSIIVSSLLIYGVEKNRLRYLTPYIVYLWINIVVSVVVTIGLIVFFAIYEPTVAIIFGIIMIIVIALNIYYLIVIRSYQAEMRNTPSAPQVFMQDEGKKEAKVWKS